MNVATILKRQAVERAHVPAILDPRRGRSLTFAEVESVSARAAALLRTVGLVPGDRVLVALPLSSDLYVALAALLRLGLVAMFVDLSAGRAEIDRCCRLCPPRALIAGGAAHWLRMVAPALRRIPIRFCTEGFAPGAVSWKRATRLAALEEVEPCGDEAGALLTFTSGSTGLPKAALRTHGCLLAQHRALHAALGLAPGEIDLVTLPVFGLANLASGVTSLIPDADLRRPGEIDPGPALAQIERYRPARVVASPALLERLAERCERDGRSLAGVRRICAGGAPVFPDVLERLQRAAPEAEVVAVYGSTEAEPIACVSQRDIGTGDYAAMRGGLGLLAGRPLPCARLRVLPDLWGAPLGPWSGPEFEAFCLPSGRAGEIVVGGSHVLPGYVGGRGDEETKLRVDGEIWHRTGDAGYVDGEGRVWLLGRCSARIDDAGGRLYPFSVECAARRHPGVRRAAVVSSLGRRVLLLEMRRPATERDLDSLRQSLSWARIDALHACPRLPVDRRHNAKIDYTALERIVRRLDRPFVRSGG